MCPIYRMISLQMKWKVIFINKTCQCFDNNNSCKKNKERKKKTKSQTFFFVFIWWNTFNISSWLHVQRNLFIVLSHTAELVFLLFLSFRDSCLEFYFLFSHTFAKKKPKVSIQFKFCFGYILVLLVLSVLITIYFFSTWFLRLQHSNVVLCYVYSCCCLFTAAAAIALKAIPARGRRRKKALCMCRHKIIFKFIHDLMVL